MMKEIMIINNSGKIKMSYKNIIFAGFVGLLGLAGCANEYEDYPYEAAPTGQVPVQAQQQPQPQVQTQMQAQMVCPNAQYPDPYTGSCVAGGEFVDYTTVAADYRAYGELTPRDHMIVNGGAGSNMTAAIPPSFEGEIIEYDTSYGSGDIEQLYTENGADGGYVSEDTVEDWLAEEGKGLKSILTEWCDKAGWRLVWKTNRNYTLTAGAMFRGRFSDVTSALIKAFARARPAPIATFYKGNRVLVVDTMEDENAYE